MSSPTLCRPFMHAWEKIRQFSPHFNNYYLLLFKPGLGCGYVAVFANRWSLLGKPGKAVVVWLVLHSV
jgi:hypothetical protein